MSDEKLLRKHVAIIHAYSLMSALQRKIFNVLLYEVINNSNLYSHQNSVAIESRISFIALSRAINFNSNNRQYLKEAIDGLASLKIEWNILKDKVPTDISFLNLRVLHGSPTFYQDNTFNFSLHKIMLDLCLNPSVYGTVDLKLQSQFESKYSHSLYENSTRFVNLQKNKIIQLDSFRKLLGIDSDKYTAMREFTRNVVMPSIEEVNDRANFIVSLNNIKMGRKITGYEFSVKSKQKFVKPIIQSVQAENKKTYEEIKSNFGELNKVVIENIFKNHTDKYILEKIEYTKKHAKKKSTGFYPIPYFISALKNDYRSVEDNAHIKECSKQNEVQELKYHIRMTHSDINHWKQMLEFHIDLEARKNIQKNLEESKEKLKEYSIKAKILEEKNNHI